MRYLIIILSFLFVSPVFAMDCQTSAKSYLRSGSGFPVTVKVNLPKGLDSNGKIELLGFRCFSEVKPGQSYQVSMSKQAAYPQFDVIYNSPTNTRYNNILQGRVYPWSKEVTIDIRSTIVGNIIRTKSGFRQLDASVQKRLYRSLEQSQFVNDWAKIREANMVKEPFKYPYPLSGDEKRFGEKAKEVYEQSLSKIHQIDLAKVKVSPEEITTKFFNQLIKNKKKRSQLDRFTTDRFWKSRYQKTLLNKKITELTEIKTTFLKQELGEARIEVRYKTDSNDFIYTQKFHLKRAVDKWLIYSISPERGRRIK